MKTHNFILLLCLLWTAGYAHADSNVIEKQLVEIGSIPNEEVVVVQKKYTKKNFRHELTPIRFGGLPFGDIRRTLFAGASYTLHLNDAFALELFDFTYTKDFFTGFTDDINTNQTGPKKIKPDIQRLLYMITPGIQFSPMYGKASTMSHYIAYLEPYISLNAGLAKTESSTYFTFAPGVGLRIFFKEWFSMKVEFRDYIYKETVVDRANPGSTKTTTRNNYSVAASLSFWIPKML